MTSSPVEQRAFGLLVREVEQTLRERLACLPYSDGEIDEALALLVSAEGRTVGGTLRVDELGPMWTHDLWVAGMIKNDSGRWVLSDKRRDMSRLLDVCASPDRRLKLAGHHQ